MALRIGVNALYLIPGGVGGTEIYLRNLLSAAAAVDGDNTWVMFTNRETGADLVPKAPNFVHAPQPVRAAMRPARILWEQMALPMAAARRHLDVILTPASRARCCRMCERYCVSRPATQAASGVFSPVRFAGVAVPVVGRGASLARADCGLRGHPRRSAAILWRGRHSDPSWVRAGTLRPRRTARTATLPPLPLHTASAQEPRSSGARVRGPGADRFPSGDCRLRGFYADELDALIASLGLSDHVRITGWIPRGEIHELLRHGMGCDSTVDVRRLRHSCPRGYGRRHPRWRAPTFAPLPRDDRRSGADVRCRRA